VVSVILPGMFRRQRTGSVVCASCGYLVGVNDPQCYHCGRRNPGLWGFAPAFRSLGHDMGFVPFVMGTCVVVYVLTLLMSGAGMSSFFSPSPQVLDLFGASGFVPVVLEDRWWTVLSANWLHGNLLHIGLNLWWLRQLAPPVADMYGPGRMVSVYNIAGIIGFTLSSFGYYLWFMPPMLRGAGFTVGASASIMGLVGALAYYGHRTGSSIVRKQAISMAVQVLVFGLFFSGVDNFAHIGGFAGGYVAGRILDPLKPERIDHIILAVLGLVLSLLSIVVSVMYGLSHR
jgi:rhomboid protease GluP